MREARGARAASRALPRERGWRASPSASQPHQSDGRGTPPGARGGTRRNIRSRKLDQGLDTVAPTCLDSKADRATGERATEENAMRTTTTTPIAAASLLVRLGRAEA